MLTCFLQAAEAGRVSSSRVFWARRMGEGSLSTFPGWQGASSHPRDTLQDFRQDSKHLQIKPQKGCADGAKLPRPRWGTVCRVGAPDGDTRTEAGHGARGPGATENGTVLGCPPPCCCRGCSWEEALSAHSCSLSKRAWSPGQRKPCV